MVGLILQQLPALQVLLKPNKFQNSQYQDRHGLILYCNTNTYEKHDPSGHI